MRSSVFVIIVTYNGAKWIRKCIQSTQSSLCAPEFVVVDNNSTDNTLDILRNEFSGISLIEQNQNLGFGKANNLGIKYALEKGADYLLLLNQDAYPQNNMLEKLLEVYQNNNDLGIISPVHLNINGGLDFGFEDHVKRYTSKKESDVIFNQQEGVINIGFVNAACWLVSRKTIETVGLFNPIFPHYGEDNDYINRLHYFGLDIKVCSSASVIHDRNQSNNLTLNKLIKRENVSFMKHLANINSSLLKALYNVIFKWLKETLYYLVTGRWKSAYAVNSGFLRMLSNLSMILKSRRSSKVKGAYL